ncbi:MAG: response regulator transcription factor [Bacteroidales bacterium]|nr:response regulator transcription factor [Bacteroidales bacterium]
MDIWLVDDHQLFRTGFRTLLQRIDGVRVTFEASDGEQFLEQLKTVEQQPDIVFMDISMPRMNGLQATEAALSAIPDVNIIILSMFGEKEYYSRLINIGIKGFLLKSCDFSEVETAIKAVSEGDMYFSEELLAQMSTSNNTVAANVSEEDKLSDRELDVLALICSGESNQEIADHLFISKRTVEKHRANLMVKTGCANTASLVVYAVKMGLYRIGS